MEEITLFEFQYIKDYTEKLYCHPLCRAFLRPVDPELDGAPDYLDFIAKPMDLGTVRENIYKGVYKNSQQWYEDLCLIWSNAQKYNDKRTLIYQVADLMDKKCKRHLKVIPKTPMQLWELRVEKANKRVQQLLEYTPLEECAIPKKEELTVRA